MRNYRPLITVQPRADTKYFYTLDGTFPTESSSLYTEPFTVGKTDTLMVRGFKPGSLPGAVARARPIFRCNTAWTARKKSLYPMDFSFNL